MPNDAPDIPLAELWWRFERANNLLMANQGRRVMTSFGDSTVESTKHDERAWLITFLSGGLQAESTRS